MGGPGLPLHPPLHPGLRLEVEEGTLEDLLLAPGGKEWIYLGKLLFQMLLLLPLSLLALFLAAGLFYLPLERGLSLFLTLALGTLGYASVATFYAGLLARLRGREALLPLLLFSLVVPVSWPRCGPRRGLWKAFPWGRWPPGGSFSWCLTPFT